MSRLFPPEVTLRAGAPLRLGAHVLAHLRAIAEGLSVADCARRYLVSGADDETWQRANRAAVDAATSVARRAGLGTRWRLLRIGQLPAAALAAQQQTAPPVDLEAWAEERGYEEFSFAELEHAYREAFADAAPPLSPQQERKARQIERLRRARLALLDELRKYTATPPALTDPVDLWLPDELAARVRTAGFLMLGELRTAIAQGGRWWRGLPGFGPIKARALADLVGALVGWPDYARDRTPALDVRALENSGAASALVEKWITARASKSKETERAYRREAQRFLAWLAIDRGHALDALDTDACSAYIAFLADIPLSWRSRSHAERFAPGWAPFFKQPSVTSQRYALTVVNAFCAWLARAGHLPSNPWEMVNVHLSDDPNAPIRTSRAFSNEAWDLLLAHVDDLRPPAAARMRWLLVFLLSCGLRAAEVLRARRADLQQVDGAAWWLRVHGKGARNRSVPVPSVAMNATRKYFAARGVNFERAHPNTPLLATLDTPDRPGNDTPPPGMSVQLPKKEERAERGYISYSTLAAAFTRFAQTALNHSALPLSEVERMYAASLHWLRHTHATRAVESGVPIDVLQANLGQADPATTARYYSPQDKRRQQFMEQAFTIQDENRPSI
jgi:integrase